MSPICYLDRESVFTMTNPFFSVVIPVRDRPAELAGCLQALCGLDPPDGRFEVIVVDDGSAAAVAPVVAPFADTLVVTLLHQEHRGPAAARNRGARAARGTYLAFLDSDCLPTPGWLAALQVALADRSQDALVGGRTVDGFPENRYSAASHQILDAVDAFYNPSSDSARFFPSNNFAAPTRLFLSEGGFREDFVTSEDRELCYRWLDRGHTMVAAPEAVVRHCHAINLNTFLRRHFGYGRGAYRFHRLRADCEQHGLRLAPSGFYLALFRHPLARGLGLRALDMEALVALSQLASAAGFVWQALASENFSAPGRATLGTP
jgi:glycosyltransferase involved in cell wall biosynthesis